MKKLVEDSNTEFFYHWVHFVKTKSHEIAFAFDVSGSQNSCVHICSFTTKYFLMALTPRHWRVKRRREMKQMEKYLEDTYVMDCFATHMSVPAHHFFT